MRNIFYIRLMIGLISALLLKAGVVHAASTATEQALVAQVAQQLAKKYPESPIEQAPFKSAHLTMLIRDRIDARLLEDSLSIQGADFQLTLPVPKHVVAMLTLNYPTPAIALRQATRLSAHRMYFHNTKILTPFKYAVMDKTLVIVFTESNFQDLITTLVETLETETTPKPPAHEPQ